MGARPFRLFGRTSRANIAASLSPILAAWAHAWFSGAPTIEAVVDPEGGRPSDSRDQWRVFGSFPDRWLAWATNPALEDQVFAQLFDGGQASGPLGRAVVSACIADLAQRCLGSAGVPGDAMTPAMLPTAALPDGYGRGSEFVQLSGALAGQWLALGGELAEALAGRGRRAAAPGPALASLTAALAAVPVRIEVALDGAEMSVAELASMAIGDVIALDARHRDPLAVCLDGGQPILRAHLGRRSQQKAIQVATT